MSINFATLQGLTIPEGVVTQITDAAGNVLWALANKPVILEVAKITSNTYAAETTYENEQFILLNIYPKNASSTVNVTYGGLTKTLTFSGINSQQVYFGTFNGVSDSVTTPDRGTLTIEGGYSNFAVGTYVTNSKTPSLFGNYCGCITGVTEWGSVTSIGSSTFRDCTNLTLTSLPSGITSIGNHTFYNCTNLALTSLPSGITSIGDYAFYECRNLALTSLPSGITSIGNYAFHTCTNLTLTSLPSGITSIGDYAFRDCTNLTLTSLPSGITSIGNHTFYNCTNLTLTSLPSGITSIGNYTFYSCTNLTLTSLPSGITSIGDYAFYRCCNNEFMRLPEGLTTLGSSSFHMGNKYDGDYVEPKVKDFILPSTLTSIGGGCFAYGTQYYNYTYCNTLTLLSQSPPSGTGLGAYNPDVEITAIIVPGGCGDVYKAAEGWSDYASYIVEAL